jgi:hypothetical protein
LPAEVGAFGWGVEDGVVFGWFDFYYFVFFCYEGEFAHAEGAGVMGCSGDDAVVGYDCWFVEYFFASLVGAFEFVFVVVAVENLRELIPPYA